ncbi:MAG: hypothetical protein L0Y32_03905, partial [Nevskiales bacterium]|nr:hypothetical protein [Nevskiales bacterium]
MKKNNEATLAAHGSRLTAHESLLISGARVLNPASTLDTIAYVGIHNGVIAHVGREKPREPYAAHLSARGLWLIPGAVDLCARLREPGAAHKATFRTEAPAAAAGGITTVCIPPDTRPVIDTPSVVDRVRARAAKAGGLDIHVLGALTQGLAGSALPDMA